VANGKWESPPHPAPLPKGARDTREPPHPNPLPDGERDLFLLFLLPAGEKVRMRGRKRYTPHPTPLPDGEREEKVA